MAKCPFHGLIHTEKVDDERDSVWDYDVFECTLTGIYHEIHTDYYKLECAVGNNKRCIVGAYVNYKEYSSPNNYKRIEKAEKVYGSKFDPSKL